MNQPLSRRQVFLLTGAGISALARLHASTDPWNRKPPTDWTSDDIDKLLTKSPWAREVTAEYAPGEGRYDGENRGGGSPRGTGYPGGGTPRVGIGLPRIPGIGMPGGGRYPGGGGGGGYPGGGGGGQRRGGNASSYKGTVRWESATPILEAVKTDLPDVFKDHYVLFVGGIPLLDASGRRSDDQDDRDAAKSERDQLDNVKSHTFLQPKGKERADAGIVQRQIGSSHNFLFGFSKDALTLTGDDREVLFQTRLGRLIVKAKFDPHEMKYRGKLAL
jgi:hypothetical protein